MRRWAGTVLVAALLAAAWNARADDDVDQLVADLASRSEATRAHAVDRLAFAGPRRAGTPVAALLASTDPDTRSAAIDALAAMGDHDEAPAIAKRLGDSAPPVRLHAAQALGTLHAKSAAKALGKALASDPVEAVRIACASALAKTGGAGNALGHAAAKDDSLEVRLAALDALALRMDRSQSGTLASLLNDRVGLVRFAAARALAWAGDARGRTFLAKALSSRDPDARRRALTVLADCPKRWAADLLARSLDDDDLALDGAKALATRGDERGIAALARLSRGGRDAQAAVDELDRLGVPADERARLATETR